MLIWTKARKDWDREEALLRPKAGASYQVLHIPCIEIHALALVLPATPPDYVVITSANAAKQAAADPAMRQAMAQAKQVYTHGAKTAAVLQQLGIRTTLVRSAQTAEELCAWLGTQLPRSAQVWLPTAAEPAFDMQAGLLALGHAAHALPCYETTAEAKQASGEAFAPAQLASLQQRLQGVVCFASPSAVVGFAKVFQPNAPGLAQSLRACVIGPTTAAAAAPWFDQVTLAKEASVEGLVAAAIALLG